MRYSASLTALAAVLFHTPVPAFAQADDVVVMEEIIVTATKREQSLNEIPVSVGVLTSDRIELIGAQDISALVGRVAGVSVETSQPGFTRFVIRGVNAGGQFGWRQGSATAVYLDETPLTTRANFFFASPDINLYDLERVEVLRGPQGTMFGSSAIGGAVRAIPAAPDYDNVEGSAEIELSQTRNAGDPNYVVRAAYNTPLADGQLALRLAGEYTRLDGFIDAILTSDQDFIAGAETAPRIEDYNDQERLTLRAALGWQPAPNVEVTPSILYQRNEAGGAGDYALNAFGSDDPATIFAFNPTFEAHGEPYEFVDDQLIVASLKAEVDLEALGGLSFVGASSYQDRSAEARDDSVAANGGFVSAYGFDANYQGGVDPFFSEFETNVEQFTQEFRLVTTGNQPIQFVGGLYFNSLKQTDSLVFSFEGSPQSVFDTYGVLAPEGYDGVDEFSEDEYAAFIDAEYAFGSGWTLGAGARLTHYEQTLERGAAFPAFGDPGDLANPSVLEASETKLTPRVRLSYEPLEGLLFYGSAAEGFRTGGGNPPENLRGSCPNRAELPAQPDQFDADSAWSYELGSKYRSRGGELNLRAAAFQVDWSDIQNAVVFQCSDNTVVSFVGNAGDARIQGIELEADLAVSSEFSIFGAIGYTDAAFTEDAPEAGVTGGDPLGYVPEWTVNIGALYEAEAALFSDFRPYATADYRHVSTRDDPNYGLRANPDFGADLPSQSIVDARMGLRGETIDISIFARNLFDEDAPLQQLALFAPGAFSPTGFDTRTQREQVITRPRTFGVTARLRY